VRLAGLRLARYYCVWILWRLYLLYQAFDSNFSLSSLARSQTQGFDHSIVCVYNRILCFLSLSIFFSWSAAPKTRLLKVSAGSCSGQVQVCVAIAGINAATDIVIYLMPIAIVWNLQLTGRKKLGVTIIFAFGLLCVRDILLVRNVHLLRARRVCIASAARFVGQIVRFHDPDYLRIREIFLPLKYVSKLLYMHYLAL
jgi:hypothetical protein